MDNNTPVAPTGAQAPASVASTTNSNEQAPATPPTDTSSTSATTAEPTAEQIAKYLGTTTEGLEKFKKFSDNNGGFDKVFSERKKEITTPQAQQPQAPTHPVVEPQQLPQQATTPNGLNMEYIEGQVVKDYFKELAEKPEYANIATQCIPY